MLMASLLIVAQLDGFDDGSFTLENKLWIGIGDGRNNNNPFKGKIDDFRLYKTNLSADQIKSIYKLESPRDYSSLVGENVFSISEDSLSKTLYIYPVDDKVYEGFETITLTVDTTDYGKATSSSVDIVIEDNDDAPEVSLRLAREYVSEQDRFNKVDLVATLTNPNSKTVEVPLVFDGETDTLDFEISSNSIVIDPDQEEGRVQITVLKRFYF